MYHSVDQISVRDSVRCFAETFQSLHLSLGTWAFIDSGWEIFQIIFLQQAITQQAKRFAVISL